jgi:protein tyrosine phosphatase
MRLLLYAILFVACFNSRASFATERERCSPAGQGFGERLSVSLTSPEYYRKKGSVRHSSESFKTPENPKAFASPTYNCSMITLDGKQFLAMAAPSRENLPAFYQVLRQYNVTDLVRLTPAIYKNKEESFPYWVGHVNIHPKSGRPTIELDGREMNYFFTDCWNNHEGYEPARLIAAVKAVMANDGPNQMIAVHCHAGIGRSGTFIAAYALIRDIDEQLAQGVSPDQIRVSVNKVVWQLVLGRPCMVAGLPQYMSLYNVVEEYIDMKSRERCLQRPRLH